MYSPIRLLPPPLRRSADDGRQRGLHPGRLLPPLHPGRRHLLDLAAGHPRGEVRAVPGVRRGAPGVRRGRYQDRRTRTDLQERLHLGPQVQT